MTTMRTRASKGSELTHGELDANFDRDVDVKTTTYAALVSDNRTTLECNHASTPFTVTLGDAATMAAAETGDYEVTIANIGAAAVTVARAGTDTIDGVATSIVLAQYSSVTLKVNAATDGYNSIGRGLGGLTSTVAELNILDGVTSTAAELNYNDITTLGTTEASKVVTTDGSGDINHAGSTIFADGEGVDFSSYTDGSIAGTTTSQVLVDYEEGDWVPVLSDGTNDATMTASTKGLYTKTGRAVHLTATVNTSSLGSVSGNLRITGLPYDAHSTAGASAGVCSNVTGFAITAGENISVTISNNGSWLVLNISNATTGTNVLQESEWTADGFIRLGITYSV